MAAGILILVQISQAAALTIGPRVGIRHFHDEGKLRCSFQLCEYSVVERVLTAVFRCAGAAIQAVRPDGGDLWAPDSIGSTATPPWGGGTVE